MTPNMITKNSGKNVENHRGYVHLVFSLRRKAHAASMTEPAELEELIKDVRVQLIGPVRQEILSGIKSRSQFDRLKKVLSFFPDLPLTSEDYALAAEY